MKTNFATLGFRHGQFGELTCLLLLFEKTEAATARMYLVEEGTFAKQN
jgi:hypothetical protein